jgi:hypothetical protein
MTQTLIFKLAERVLFGKRGGSKQQKITIYQNVRAIRKALKCPKDTKDIQRKPSAQVIIAALKGRGWHHRTISCDLLIANEGGDGTERQLAMYGGVTQDASGHKRFKITDRRLQKIWNAISRFIQEYGSDLQLGGDLLIQQASILVMLNRRYQQVIATKEADSYAFTQQKKEEARELRQQQRKEAIAAVLIQAHIRGLLARARANACADAALKTTLADLSGCFGDWDDEEDMEELNERHAKEAEEAELKRQQEVKEQTEWLESFMSDKQDKKPQEAGAKKKKKKKSHQVRKMEAAKARKKARKKAGKR